jgi:hypothetical protein
MHQELQKMTRLFLLCLWAPYRTAWNEWKVLGHSAKSADSDGINYPISLYVVGESILVSQCYFGSVSQYAVSNLDVSVRGQYCTGRIRSSSVANQNTTIVRLFSLIISSFQ